jgi:hypothetical protein
MNSKDKFQFKSTSEAVSAISYPESGQKYILKSGKTGLPAESEELQVSVSDMPNFKIYRISGSELDKLCNQKCNSLKGWSISLVACSIGLIPGLITTTKKIDDNTSKFILWLLFVVCFMVGGILYLIDKKRVDNINTVCDIIKSRLKTDGISGISD